jgi:hypothetical protein
MKNIINKTLLAGLTLLTALVFTTCQREEPGKYEMTGGVPAIKYVRYPGSENPDRLLDGALMGENIILVGDNLTSIKELYFNDQKALLNVNFITANTLFTSVPTNVPQERTDKIWMITDSGERVGYDFEVRIPAPKLNKIKCEMMPENGEAVLYGDYFFDSNLKITIGNTEIPAASIISIEKTILKFKAPATTVTGPITVSTTFGASQPTTAWFNDVRGFITGFEDTENDGAGFVAGWGRPSTFEEDPLYAISGKYVKLSGNITTGAWVATEDSYTINIWGENIGVPSGNLFPSDPAASILKFEINVLETWSGLPMVFGFTAQNDGQGFLWADAAPRGVWVPWLETGAYTSDGWETVAIPLTSFKYNGAGEEVPLPTAYGSLYITLHNRGNEAWVGTDCSPVILIDNVRVVPQ